MDTLNSQDTAVQAYVQLVKAAEAVFTSVSRGLAEHGLTASQFSAMKVLRTHGALPQRDIAKSLLQTGGNITLVVDNLERDRLVTRKRDKIDRRIVLVELTQTGAELFDRIYPNHLERIQHAMSVLTPIECSQLLELAQTLNPGSTPVCVPEEQIA